MRRYNDHPFYVSTLEKRESLDLSDLEKSPFEQFNQNYIPGKVHVKIECNIWPVFSTTNQ